MIAHYLTKDGKIKVWPAKVAARMEVLKYLGGKFCVGRDYTEKEVNRIVEENHSFGDYPLLRRAMIDHGILERLPDGSRYWKPVREDE